MDTAEGWRRQTGGAGDKQTWDKASKLNYTMITKN